MSIEPERPPKCVLREQMIRDFGTRLNAVRDLVNKDFIELETLLEEAKPGVEIRVHTQTLWIGYSKNGPGGFRIRIGKEEKPQGIWDQVPFETRLMAWTFLGQFKDEIVVRMREEVERIEEIVGRKIDA